MTAAVKGSAAASAAAAGVAATAGATAIIVLLCAVLIPGWGRAAVPAPAQDAQEDISGLSYLAEGLDRIIHSGAIYNASNPIIIDTGIYDAAGQDEQDGAADEDDGPQADEGPQNLPDETQPAESVNETGLQEGSSAPAEPADLSGMNPYLVYVSKGSHTIAILGLDDGGEYTRLLHTFSTATGRSSSMTRAGTYEITGRERWHHWGGGTYSPYTVSYSGGVFFHGPIYTRKDPYTLKANSYNEIGTKATSGCMRTYTFAAKWIYDNCEDGTTVIIANDSLYTSTPPEKISGSQKYDPTDPDLPENIPEEPELPERLKENDYTK